MNTAVTRSGTLSNWLSKSCCRCQQYRGTDIG